jgi:small subunit ribosomal protein S3Ae
MDGDYLRSLVRRRSLRVDSNIDVTTKDGYDVRMKTLCFTLKKAQKLQVGMIRQVAEETIRDRARNLEFNNYVQEIILGKLASDIYKNAKKIYPLRRVEINKMEIIK